MKLQLLTGIHAIPDVLAFQENEHGLISARVTSKLCNAELFLHGAHLTRWQPTGHNEALFLSDRSSFEQSKAIRGGIPIIFPWFGARTANALSDRTDGPSHGFARTSEWEFAAASLIDDEVHMTLTLEPNDASKALGFDHFRVAYEIILGAELSLKLTVANQAKESIVFEEALHSYFMVGDARLAKIIGLETCKYIDKTDGNKQKKQNDPVIVLQGETDRPYTNTESPVEIEDPVLERGIIIGKSDSKTTVVWNPWSELTAKMADMSPDGWQNMVCIESANAGENAITLHPGEQHTMKVRVGIKELG